MTDDSTDPTTRRTFLSATATTGALLGVGSITDVEGVLGLGRQDVATHYRLGGKTSGWRGIEPPSIAQAINPVLNLEAGKKYAVTWKNIDGAPHNFAIIGQDGNVLLQTDIVDQTGATQTTRFTATEQMDVYLCQVHPTSMRGQIALGAAPPQGNETVNQTTTTIPNPTAVAENETTHPLADEFGENPQKFLADLEPAQGVQTDATGTTWFTLHPPNGEEPKLMYSLYLQNISGVTRAGIYLETDGDDPLVVPLFQPENPTDEIEGTLVDSLLVAEDLQGPFAQATLLRLIEAIRNDKVFVLVQTEQYPDGVLRGPIRAIAETGGQVVGNQTAGNETAGNETTAGNATTEGNQTAANAVDSDDIVQRVRAPGFGALTALGGLAGAATYFLRGDGDD